MKPRLAQSQSNENPNGQTSVKTWDGTGSLGKEPTRMRQNQIFAVNFVHIRRFEVVLRGIVHIAPGKIHAKSPVMLKPFPIRRWLILLLALVCAAANGEQLGPVYPIVEPDLLEDIYANLKAKEASGELARLEKEGIERAKRSALSPTPVSKLKRTIKPHKFYFDPSFVADRDVRDHEGKLVVKKGMRLNPLEYVSLPQNFLFFDGRDPEQVAYVGVLIKSYQGQVRPIMTGGNVREANLALKTRTYFDQGGYLIRRFGIQHVPAMVSQERGAKVLRIDEMPVPEEVIARVAAQQRN